MGLAGRVPCDQRVGSQFGAFPRANRTIRMVEQKLGLARRPNIARRRGAHRSAETGRP